jgi:sugar lactone lactonase YvrE
MTALEVADGSGSSKKFLMVEMPVSLPFLSAGVQNMFQAITAILSLLLILVAILTVRRGRSHGSFLWWRRWVGRFGNVLALACVLGTPAPLRAGGGSLTVRFNGVQTVVNSGFSLPHGVAVDGSGNVYVVDTLNNQVLKETPSGGGYIQSTVVTGLNFPLGVAADGIGNVYIADTYDNQVLIETPSGGGYIQSTVGSGLSLPGGVAVDGSGNVYIADSDNGRVLRETPSAGSYTQSTVASGFSSPQGVGVDGSGNVYVADYGAGEVLLETFSAGSYTQSTVVGGLSFPDGVAVDGNGDVYIADNGNNRVLVAVPSGGSYSFTTMGGGLAAPVGVAVDGSGNLYIADSGNNRALEVQRAANFGGLNLRSASSVMSLLYAFSGASGTIGVPAVLTQGVPSLDFADAGTGTCTTNGSSHVYFSGDTCAVDVTFTPQFPGIRYGAAVVVTNSGSRATGFASGVGLGAQATFAPGTQSTIGSGLVIPFGIAVDASGNVFVADQVGTLYKETLSGGVYTQSTLATGLSSDSGVAVDGAGNLYVDSVSTGDVIKFTLANGTYTQSTAVSALGNLNGVAVDRVGNLFMVSYSNNACYKETLLPNGSYLQAELGNSFSGPTGVAVDASGNVYISNDNSGNIYKETPQPDGSYVQTTLLTGFVAPEAVAVDDNGNLYIADTGPSSGGFVSGVAYKEELQGGGSYVQSVIASGLTKLWWIAVDQQGKLYLSQRSPGIETIINLATPPALTFASTAVGSVSSGSPQTVSLSNIGNTPLFFPIPGTGNNPSISPNFTLTSSGVNACPLVASGGSTGSLAANTDCDLVISFAPTQVGAIAGSLVLTDTTLNAAGPAYATQTVALSGVGTQASTTTALAATPSPAAVGQSVTLTATVSPTPTGSPLGTVSFFDGASLLNTASVNSSGIATFSTTSLSAGAHSLTAVYSGNVDFLTSTSSIFTETISVLTSTTTALAGSPNPAEGGASVTLTATISPAPTGSSLGTVSFYDEETLLGSANVNSSGVATFTTTSLPASANGLTAVYSGNSAFASSTSSVFTETVSTLVATATLLAAAPSPAVAGEAVALTATVSPAPTGASLGTVSFYNGSTLLGTVSIGSSGVATFTSSSLPTGTLGITAVYSGNAASAGSTSASFTETVTSAYTVTAPSTPVTATEGGSVQIDVTVPPLGGAFNSVVTLSATGLPPGATVRFNPPTVTPGSAGAPSIMTIQLAPLAAGMLHPGRSPYRHLPLTTLALVMGLCAGGFRGKRLASRGMRLLALAIILVSVGSTIGCGGGFLGPPTTHPGSYVVTITGTSGALTASTTVTVVVQ